MDAFIHWLLFLLNMEHMDYGEINLSRLPEGVKIEYVADGDYFAYGESVDGKIVYVRVGVEAYGWSQEPI